MEILALFTLLLTLTQESIGTRHVVYWDRNQISKLSKEGLEITLEVDDYMDVLCPFAANYDEFDYPKRNEVLLRLYNVTKAEYMNCDTTNGIRLQSCDDPLIEKKLTTKFQERSPYPFGFTFRAGATYYYLSKPLHDVSNGCTQDAMRMMVHVKRKGTVFDPDEHERTVTYHLMHDETPPKRTVTIDTIPDNHKQPNRHHQHEKATTTTPTRPTRPIIQYETPRHTVHHPHADAVRNSNPGNGVAFHGPTMIVLTCTMALNLVLFYCAWLH